MRRFLAIFICIGVIWFMGIKPLLAEIQDRNFEVAMAKDDISQAEIYMKKALILNPASSKYQMNAAQFYYNLMQYDKATSYIERVLYTHNGDLVPWGCWFLKGQIASLSGHLYQARNFFETSLSYNTRFTIAEQTLRQAEKAIAEYENQ